MFKVLFTASYIYAILLYSTTDLYRGHFCSFWEKLKPQSTYLSQESNLKTPSSYCLSGLNNLSDPLISLDPPLARYTPPL